MGGGQPGRVVGVTGRPVGWEVLGLAGDPTPGDPDVIIGVAGRFGRLAADAEDAAARVRSAAGDTVVASWVGLSGEAFRGEIGQLPGQLSKLSVSFGLAGRALRAYAEDLTAAQHDADRALAAGRTAAEQLASAQAWATTTRTDEQHTTATLADLNIGGLTALPSVSPGGVLAPTAGQVTTALRAHQAAAVRVAQAAAALADAQAGWDTARRLALAAGQVRAAAETTAVHALGRASHAGIRNSSWRSHLAGAAARVWHDTVTAATVAGVVLAVVSLVACGPVIVGLLVATGLVVLTDTLIRWREGKAGWSDVALAAVACLPGGRLAEGAEAADRLTVAARTLRAAPTSGRVAVWDGRVLSIGVEGGDWGELLARRVDQLARSEADTVAAVTEAVRPHLAALAGTWETLSVAERTQLARTIQEDVAGAMYAPPARTVLRRMGRASFGLTQARSRRYIIAVNNRLSLDETVGTLVHETRHTYQMHQGRWMIAGETDVHPDSMVWALNFQKGIYTTPEANYEKYLRQPVELDAMAMEHLVGRQLGRR